MTLSEVKAWLDGFEEAMAGKPPTAEQWKAIKAKLDLVTDSKKPVQLGGFWSPNADQMADQNFVR